jgi:hypothetical protein
MSAVRTATLDVGNEGGFQSQVAEVEVGHRRMGIAAGSQLTGNKWQRAE